MMMEHLETHMQISGSSPLLKYIIKLTQNWPYLHVKSTIKFIEENKEENLCDRDIGSQSQMHGL